MRRILTAFAALALALPLLTVTALVGAAPLPEPGAFPFGVGSNDVTPSAASLWTQTSARRVIAVWSTDPSFAARVHRRGVDVHPKHDGTVLVRVGGLAPDTTYHFKFVDPRTGAESRVGTFRTAPSPSRAERLTFAYSGDQDGTRNPATGQPCFNHFETFAQVLREAPAFYVNLGDTIYADSACLPSPNGTLAEYRANYRQNLSYQALRDLRAATSFFTQWDDHEVRNDWDAQTVDPALRAIGTQAFQEYDAMRPPSPSLGFYRTFRWGRAAQLFILDERSFRSIEADRMDADGDGTPDCDNPVTGQPDLAPTLAQPIRDQFAAFLPGSGLSQPVPALCTADLEAAGRTMLGRAQRDRFLRDLANSKATFKIVLTEDPMQQFFALPYDRWEGYRWERARILDFVQQHHIANVLWLATDVHAYLAHTVDANTDTPGSAGGVEGMFEYTVGPVATSTFGQGVDAVLGAGTANLIRAFLLGLNGNTCANLGGTPGVDPGAPFYGYGLVTVDAAAKTVTVVPKDASGVPIAANGNPSAGRDPSCFAYQASAS
jgi:phosphodiesterase/alkaline phosphatase D-like protein